MPLDTTRAPTNDELLEILARNGRVPFDQLRAQEGGRIHDVPPVFVQPADPVSAGRFELLPTDAVPATERPAVDNVMRWLRNDLRVVKVRQMWYRLYRDGKLWVRDDGSINGVFVRLRGPKIVPSGTRLIVGEQLLRIDQAPPEPALIPDAEGTYFYSSPSGTARLVLTQLLVGGDVGLVYRARNDNVTIGREGNDVNFPEDPFISGRHVQIRALDDGRFQVTDLGSKNGTYERVPQLLQLVQGDHVFLGQQLLRVELNG